MTKAPIPKIAVTISLLALNSEECHQKGSRRFVLIAVNTDGKLKIMNTWLRKFLTTFAALAAIAGIGIFFACWHFGVWSWNDWEIYECMSHECHPVWRDLQAGRIKAGDKIDGLIWRTHPSHIEKFENVTMLSYGGGFTGVSIMAKDNQVVSAGAWSCTWKKEFFDNWDKDDKDAFWMRYNAHREALWKAKGL